MSISVRRSLASTAVALLTVGLTAAAAAAAPPPNDIADGATVVPALPTTITQDTSEATDEPLDDVLDDLCEGGVPPANRASVWFSVTATDSGGFAVNAGEATDYSVGFLVTAGDPAAADVVACAPGDVVVPTTAPGTTYFVMAFSDTFDVNGGTLEVEFLRVPATPTVAVDVSRHAALLRDGSVRLRGTYTCTGGESVDLVRISGTVQQDDSAASDAFTLTLDDPDCDGRAHRWRAEATPEAGRADLERGPATAHVDATACNPLDCVFSTAEPFVVKLLGAGRR